MARLVSDSQIKAFRAIVENNFDYTCDVQRPISPGNDSHGKPLPSVWTTHLSSEPCTFHTPQRTEQGEKRTVDVNYLKDAPTVGFAVGTDIRPTDRLINLRDRFGVYVQFGNKIPNYVEILQVVPLKLKLEVAVRGIS